MSIQPSISCTGELGVGTTASVAGTAGAVTVSEGITGGLARVVVDEDAAGGGTFEVELGAPELGILDCRLSPTHGGMEYRTRGDGEPKSISSSMIESRSRPGIPAVGD